MGLATNLTEPRIALRDGCVWLARNLDVHWCRKTHDCRQGNHEKSRAAACTHSSLLSDCRCNGTSLAQDLQSCLPWYNGLYLEMWVKINPSSHSCLHWGLSPQQQGKNRDNHLHSGKQLCRAQWTSVAGASWKPVCSYSYICGHVISCAAKQLP